MPTISEYLKFANLQLAAEALFGFNAVADGGTLVPGKPYAGALTQANLTTGNLHASKFTPTQAAQFAGLWEVVEHISNTSTGFSVTLFKAKETRADLGITVNELVLSFRSTEFIDDAARDNEATNKLEIKETGWAFGQLSDMETWYQSLKSRNLIDGQISVTGYSLGAHLATAFNLMHGPTGSKDGIGQVITFNGAGVGQIGGGSAAETLQQKLKGSETFDFPST